MVAQDRSEALFAFAAVDSVHMSPIGPLRLEGLAPDTRYRVTPVGPVELAKGGPRGAPPWWSAAEGAVLTGKALAVHGIEGPGLDPQEVVLIHVIAVG